MNKKIKLFLKYLCYAFFSFLSWTMFKIVYLEKEYIKEIKENSVEVLKYKSIHYKKARIYSPFLWLDIFSVIFLDIILNGFSVLKEMKKEYFFNFFGEQRFSLTLHFKENVGFFLRSLIISVNERYN